LLTHRQRKLPRQLFDKDQFYHTELPGDRYVRLLRINQSDSETIAVMIEILPMEQLPSYEALSYTWGKALLVRSEQDNNGDEGTREILVNENFIQVTENLYDGLFALRKDVAGYLWVDSLCIGQTNIQEGASQVSLMGEIYSSAHQVIIWLGDTVSNDLSDLIWLQETVSSRKSSTWIYWPSWILRGSDGLFSGRIMGNFTLLIAGSVELG
jgi:Heterokaryon incompatibility protein (HET)